jgi:MFS family permease
MNLTGRLRLILHAYPAQFWLLFLGMLISTTGSSMIWPFWMVYVKRTLDLPLQQVTLLPLINSGVALFTTFVAGPLVDRFGRKWAMIFSLATNGLAYMVMSQATSFPMFILTSSMQGFANPIYRIGADAMMADLLPVEKRIQGYSLFRMSSNLGISIGPVIGGFITTGSYTIAFLLAAAGMIFYSGLLFIRAHETKPPELKTEIIRNGRFGGYDIIFSDRIFVVFLAAFMLVWIGVTLIWQLLPVYTITNYQIPENQFGFIFATNALMVVSLQIFVSRSLKGISSEAKLTIGGIIYALAVFGVAFATGFWGFWLCMVVMTIGELVLVPTSTTFVANVAPEDMRGRYMSIYGLAQTTAHGIGPLMGGYLSDNIGPKFIWYGGGLVALVGAAGFRLLSRKNLLHKGDHPYSISTDQ